ncbi:MAG: YihY/virulence factor BrkB family protein [Rhodocyclales bacterium GT-UBC]|nr:MAG: YihY/virulence factor BrkB family protein [Rhodocyclales bacterium GT-UBC]
MKFKPSPSTLYVLGHPAAFAWRVVQGFRRNQGLLLAGAIAYYALLSLVPLLILSVLALSLLVDQAELLATLRRYLEWLVPSQSTALLADVSGFLQSGIGLGVVLLGTMLFFSSLAFSALEKAIAIIFPHRGCVKKRHAVVSVVLPYCFVLLLSLALLAVTFASASLQALALERVRLFGLEWTLSGVSGVLLYLLGLGMEVIVLTLLYLVIPVGRLRFFHALIGGFSAAVLWEVLRHLMVWYFTRLSKVSVVYGSLTTAVVVLFCMEIAATVWLLGAQVIAEYERLAAEGGDSGG